jgi:hypothetical protein
MVDDGPHASMNLIRSSAAIVVLAAWSADVKSVAVQERAIEQRLHPSSAIVEQCERRHAAPGSRANLLEQLRPAERQARAAKTLGEVVAVDPALVETDQRPEPIPFRPLTSRFLQ